MAALYLGLGLSLSLTGWALHYAWTTHRPLSLVVLLAAARLTLSLVSEVRFRSRAQALGCRPVAAYPHRDPLLGLDLFAETRSALRENRLLPLLTRRFARHGHTHAVVALGRALLLTDDPDNVKAVLGPAGVDDFPIAGPRLLAVLPVLGPRSVFSSNGPEWRHARAMIRPAFVRDQVADLRRFDAHVANLLRALESDEAAVDLQQLFLAMTMDSSTDFMLGCSTAMLTHPTPDAVQFIRDFEYASSESARRARLGHVLLLLPHRPLSEAVARLRQFVRFYLARAAAERGDGKRHVFLDDLLASGADDEYVADQILSIVVAGRDTTASALTAVFWLLARHPDAVARLRREIESVAAENPSWEQLRGMKYLNYVVKEALRLFPPVATNSRTASRETVLPRGGGPDGRQPILVAKGTPVQWSLYSMHRRQDIYGADADEFRPERWETLRLGWEYIPFHGGPRVCLGQQFALTQIAYTLYRVFQRFEAIEPRDDRAPSLHTSLTTSFANGCHVRMRGSRSD